MKEIWKKIDFCDYYFVSNFGNVKSTFKNEKKLKPIKDNGYLYVNLSYKGFRKKTSIHRLVALYFIDNPENKKEVNHINGIKTDNNVKNLEWCTSQENQIHAYKTGLQKKGNNKLNDLDISYIEKNSHLKVSELAKMFKVCSHTIRRYIKNKQNSL